jgi:hypothetical protein
MTALLVIPVAFQAPANALQSPPLCPGTADPSCGGQNREVRDAAANTFNSPDLQWAATNLAVPTAPVIANHNLLQAEVKFTVSINGSIFFQNNNNNGCDAGDGAVDVVSDISFSSPFFNAAGLGGTVTFLSEALAAGQSQTLTVPDTVIFEGCLEFELGDAELELFKNAPLNLSHMSNSGVVTSAFCGSDFDIDTDFDAQLELEVRYVYCGDIPQDCPECIRDPRSPSSLLLFPEFNNRQGHNTLVTITNANCFNCTNGTNLPNEVFVEVVFIDKNSCEEDNFTIPMTPCDTFTFLTGRRTNINQGYIYAFAKNSGGQAISFNHLVGQEVVFNGFRTLEWSINASGFRAIPPEGALTDIDTDGVRDLDNSEYVMAPARIVIPRFLGQDPFPQFFANYRSTLTFIALSGGLQFRTVVDLAIWNDSEECFSDQVEFSCWTKRFLSNISPAFRESFLDSTNNDANEILGWSGREAGWIYLTGRSAFSGVEQITNPSIYVVLVEEKGGKRSADLPWDEGCRDGDLLPVGILGDPRPGAPGGINGDGQ